MSTPPLRSWLITLVAVILIVLRFTIPHQQPTPAGVYTAVSHLYVGSLLGAWAVTKSWDYMVPAIIMSGVELLAFFLLA
jgi:hypothetical protein